MKIYTYKNCDSCRKATKWLKAHGVEFEELPIRETPPSVEELQQMLEAKGELKLLFNTSGRDYRAMALKDKLPAMSKDEAIQLLQSNGNLIKRPFLLSDKFKSVGFKEVEWQAALS